MLSDNLIGLGCDSRFLYRNNLKIEQAFHKSHVYEIPGSKTIRGNYTFLKVNKYYLLAIIRLNTVTTEQVLHNIHNIYTCT